MSKLKKIFQAYGTLLALAVITLVFSILRPSSFFTVRNLINISRQISLMVIISIGATLVMSINEFDLSIGSMASLGGVMCALMAVSGMPLPLCFLLPVLISLAVGWVNGWIIARFRVLSFITTLGMSTVLSGVIYWLTGGATVFQNIPQGFSWLGTYKFGDIPLLSVLMVISAMVLFATIKENRLAEELKDEMALGEAMAAVETPIDDDKPMSKANRTMLLAILGAEFLWFMSDNALGTYIGNYVIYHLQSVSSATMVLTILGGLASVIGFAIAGGIADRIGRKWTISTGLAITFAGLIVMCFVAPTHKAVGERGEFAFPTLLYAVWVLKGFGMALVHNCSFPMVVELCSSRKIGRFTGFYYAASMSAQTVTPVLLGLVLNATKAWRTLPVYAAVLTALSFCVFTALVKNIKAKKVANVVGLEALGDDE